MQWGCPRNSKSESRSLGTKTGVHVKDPTPGREKTENVPTLKTPQTGEDGKQKRKSG